MGETETLARLVRTTAFADLPDAVVSKANEAILDYLGVALYGSRHDVGRRVAAYVSATTGEGSAPMIGRGEAAAPGAALANGTVGHAIDFDDTFESLVLHPTSPVFGAAFAVSGRTDATGASLLTAYVLGVETAYRVGQSVYPAHYDHGWHITGTVGALGATAAAASLLDLSANEIRHALGIAASSSSALKKNFGSMTKPLHAGHAAQSGVRAALLASRGFTADPDILDGGLGYGTVMSPGGTYDPTVIEEGGDQWGVRDVGYKPYPSGVITHAAMDALRDLVIDHDLEPADVDRVVVTLDEDLSLDTRVGHILDEFTQAEFARLRDGLTATGITAAFSIPSIHLERTDWLRELVGDLVTDGHDVALHGHRHTSYMNTGVDTARSELADAADTIEAVTGARPTGFHVPYGRVSAETVRAGTDLGVEWIVGDLADPDATLPANAPPILTPVRPYDLHRFERGDEAATVFSGLRQAADGDSLLLMHPNVHAYHDALGTFVEWLDGRDVRTPADLVRRDGSGPGLLLDVFPPFVVE
ncbi:MAG: MmgE/PrpD family protein [Halanaeroarchaeum sp.]